MALCAMLGLVLLMAPQAEAIVAFQHAAAGEVMVADGGWTKPCAVKSDCTVGESEADLSHDDEPVPHHHHCDGCVQMGAIKDRGVIASPSILNARLARPLMVLSLSKRDRRILNSLREAECACVTR